MPKYFAFLRAINVGGHTVKMEDLGRMFTEMGFTHVETFIASGNVIFDAEPMSVQALREKIEAHLRSALGYSVGAFIRTLPELLEIANCQPFPVSDPNAETGSLYIIFLQEPPTGEATRKLLSVPTQVDEFRVRGAEIFWLCRIRFSESIFAGALLEKILGVPVTVRNSTTVRKIAARVSEGAASA